MIMKVIVGSYNKQFIFSTNNMLCVLNSWR